jgi:hypothetical protein
MLYSHILVIQNTPLDHTEILATVLDITHSCAYLMYSNVSCKTSLHVGPKNNLDIEISEKQSTRFIMVFLRELNPVLLPGIEPKFST